ncbi:MAG: prepilin peptidase [Pseudonocardiales bacterium]
MLVALCAVCAVLGLCIGSFLNVVIWRVPRAESVLRPPSHCPSCAHPIRPWDNVPVVSWLVLRGRCRHCGVAISARYPLVETGTAALFVTMAIRFGFDAALPAFLYLSAVGLALALIDIDHKRLPFALTVPSYPVALLLLGAAAVIGGHPRRLIPMLGGMVGLLAFYFLLNLVSPRGMGFGDVMLAGILGLYLGYLGWGPLLVGAFLGFVLGAVGGLLFIALGRGGRKSHIPFGPYMLAGALVAVLAGHELARAYVHTTLS